MCNAKTMLKFGLGLLAFLAVLFASLPEFRSSIVNFGPVLLTLLCALHMLNCMVTMKKKPVESVATEAKTLLSPDKQEA